MSVYRRKGETEYSYDFQYKKKRYSGKCGTRNKQKALEVVRAEKARLKNCVDQEYDPTQMTLDEAAGRWFEEYGSSLKTSEDAKRSLDIILACMDPEAFLTDITSEDVANAMKTRMSMFTDTGKRITGTTANRQIIEILRRIFNTAILEWGISGLQPINWKKLRAKEPSFRRREISDDEYQAIDGVLDEHWVPFRKFLSRYGVRLGEAFFHPSAVSDVDGVVRIRLTERKGGDEHIIPLLPSDGSEMLARRSRALLAGLDTVWFKQVKHEIRPLSYTGAKSAFRRGFVRAGIDDIRINDFRHDAAVKITRKRGIMVAKQLLGHSTIATTQRYAFANDQDVLNALAEVANESPTETTTKQNRN